MTSMKVEIINPIEFHKEETQTEMMMTNFHFITLIALTSKTMDEMWSKLERVTNHGVYEIRKSETHCQISQRDTGKVILTITEEGNGKKVCPDCGDLGKLDDGKNCPCHY